MYYYILNKKLCYIASNAQFFSPENCIEVFEAVQHCIK